MDPGQLGMVDDGDVDAYLETKGINMDMFSDEEQGSAAAHDGPAGSGTLVEDVDMQQDDVQTLISSNNIDIALGTSEAREKGRRVKKKARLFFVRATPIFPAEGHVFKEPAKHWFGGLPTEIVSMIMSHLPLESLLAVSQLNHTAHAFLSTGGADPAVWARARAECRPPLEVAPSALLDSGGWGVSGSELAWAKWLFGKKTGTCVFCGQGTNGPPASVSLNLYVCLMQECRSHWKRECRRSEPNARRSASAVVPITASQAPIDPTRAPVPVIAAVPTTKDEEDAEIIEDVLEQHERDAFVLDGLDDPQQQVHPISEDIKSSPSLHPYILQHALHTHLCRRAPDEQAVVLVHLLSEAGVPETSALLRQATHLRLVALHRLRKQRGVKKKWKFGPYFAQIDTVVWPDEEIRRLVFNGMMFTETSPCHAYRRMSWHYGLDMYYRRKYRIADLQEAATAWASAGAGEKEELRQEWLEKAKSLNERIIVAQKLRRWLNDRVKNLLRLRRRNDLFLKTAIKQLGLSWTDASNSPTLCSIRRLSESTLEHLPLTRKLPRSHLRLSAPSGDPAETTPSVPPGMTAKFVPRGPTTYGISPNSIGPLGSIELKRWEMHPTLNAMHVTVHVQLPVGSAVAVPPSAEGVRQVAVSAVFGRDGWPDVRVTMHVKEALLPDPETDVWVENVEKIKDEIVKLAKRRRDREREQHGLRLRKLKLALYNFCQEKKIPCLPPYRVFCTLPTTNSLVPPPAAPPQPPATSPAVPAPPTAIECTFNHYLPQLIREIEAWNKTTRSVLTDRVLEGRGHLPSSGTELQVLDWACSLFRCTTCDRKAERVAEEQRTAALAARANGKSKKPMKVFEPVYKAPMTYAQVLAHECEGRWSVDAVELHRAARELVQAAGSMFGLRPEMTDMETMKRLGKAWVCEERNGSKACKAQLNIDELVPHLERHSPNLHLSVPDGHIMFSKSPSAHLGYRPPQPPKTILLDPALVPRDICDRLMKGSHADRINAKVQCGRCEIPRGGQGKVFSFDGLRDHLKQKHQCDTVAFEDVKLVVNV